jgi:HlyD family secretion protein
MARSKRVGLLLVGMLLWAGLCPFGSQAPLASQRQDNESLWRAEIQPRSESEEICSRVEQPMTILFVAPQGKTVKKGDLLVELDASALVDERMRQAFLKRKAESEMLWARESQVREGRAAIGQVELAEKALRLAQSQMKAFTEGEYPMQLADAKAEVTLAQERLMMTQERVNQLRAESQQARTKLQEAQLALMEASAQSNAAQSRLSFLTGLLHDSKSAELELAVAQREFELACAKDAVSAAAVRGNADLSLAEMSRAMESDRLARLEDQIGKSRIYAPRDGTIIYPNDPDEAALRPGAIVRERQAIVYLLPVAQSKP